MVGCLKSDVGFFIIGIWGWAIALKYCFVDLIDLGIAGRNSDPGRLAAQVVSGISFLGAGVIFRDRNSSSIKGLTTAAGMWATSAVGLAIGAGLYWLGVMETAVVVISQTVLHRFPVGNDALVAQELNVRIADTPEMQKYIRQFVKSHGGHIERSDAVREGSVLELKLTVRCRQPITQDEGLDLIARNPGITAGRFFLHFCLPFLSRHLPSPRYHRKRKRAEINSAQIKKKELCKSRQDDTAGKSSRERQAPALYAAVRVRRRSYGVSYILRSVAGRITGYRRSLPQPSSAAWCPPPLQRQSIPSAEIRRKRLSLPTGEVRPSEHDYDYKELF